MTLNLFDWLFISKAINLINGLFTHMVVYLLSNGYTTLMKNNHFK